MKKLYDSISKKIGANKIKVGIIFQDDKNRFLLVKEKDDRTNQYLFNIPIIDINGFNETNIIDEANKKYGIKIDNTLEYVNEFNVLDEKCENILQVNMCFDLDKNSLDRMKNYRWEQMAELEKIVNTNVKDSLEIYTYNSQCK